MLTLTLPLPHTRTRRVAGPPDAAVWEEYLLLTMSRQARWTCELLPSPRLPRAQMSSCLPIETVGMTRSCLRVRAVNSVTMRDMLMLART